MWDNTQVENGTNLNVPLLCLQRYKDGEDLRVLEIIWKDENPHHTGLEPILLTPRFIIQTRPLCRAHTIFGQWALEVSPSCEFECDRGLGQSLFRCSRCCLSTWSACRACWMGRAEMARRREIPQICRQPGKPDCKLLTTAASYHGLSVCEALPKRSDCLRLLVNRLDSCDTWCRSAHTFCTAALLKCSICLSFKVFD